MTIKISTQCRNEAGDAIVDLIDVGSALHAGRMLIYTEPRPASPETPATGTLLATLIAANPAFPSFSGGIAIANPFLSDTDIDATGQAAWFRIVDRDGNGVFDGDITLTGSGGDLQFDDINFIQHGTVALVSFTAILPQS